MAELTVVTTGANSGIGYEVALHFARRGDTVVMACRNPDKAREAQKRIEGHVPGAKIVPMMNQPNRDTGLVTVYDSVTRVPSPSGSSS